VVQRQHGGLVGLLVERPGQPGGAPLAEAAVVLAVFRVSITTSRL
jgi:hypothetical protein